MTRQEEYDRFWQPMIAHYKQERTALPPLLGLDHAQYQQLTQILIEWDVDDLLIHIEHHSPAMILRQELLAFRQHEYQELLDVLNNSLNPDSDLSLYMATIIACACLGGQHLWRDIGMPERARLSELFAHYFPSLYTANSQNMRWKRFLYKQLCESGGDYVCRAPSCDQCSSFDDCFVS
jgi:nitrogen fixation protein NifQ